MLGESEVQNNQVVVKHLLGEAEQQTIDVDNLIEHESPILILEG